MGDEMNQDDQVTIYAWRGVSWISAAIRWQTRSEYSHVAIALGGVLYEAREFRGTIKRAVEVADLREADRFTLRAHPAPEQVQCMREFLEKQVGKPYDYRMVARFISRLQETRKSRGKWFCSELVFAALQVGGVHLLARTEPWEVSPGLLTRSVLLHPVNIKEVEEV
jgi:uncharacterized protein YycO